MRPVVRPARVHGARIHGARIHGACVHGACGDTVNDTAFGAWKNICCTY